MIAVVPANRMRDVVALGAGRAGIGVCAAAVEIGDALAHVLPADEIARLHVAVIGRVQLVMEVGAGPVSLVVDSVGVPISYPSRPWEVLAFDPRAVLFVSNGPRRGIAVVRSCPLRVGIDGVPRADTVRALRVEQSAVAGRALAVFPAAKGDARRVVRRQWLR